MELKDFKKEYGKLAVKYKLPDFSELNRDFEIEKLDKDTELMLKTIRKFMMEKVVNSINFLEMLINPINLPRMYLPYVRTMDGEDRKVIDKIYSRLSQLTLVSLELEVNSHDAAEVELIKKVFASWKELKQDFGRIITNIRNPREFVNKKERSYFG